MAAQTATAGIYSFKLSSLRTSLPHSNLIYLSVCQSVYLLNLPTYIGSLHSSVCSGAQCVDQVDLDSQRFSCLCLLSAND